MENLEQKKPPSIFAIACMQKNGGIGNNQKLLYVSKTDIPGDMALFGRITKDAVVITGRKNYFSIEEAYRPLKGRINAILTRDPLKLKDEQGIWVYDDPERALKALRSDYPKKDIAVIGGADIYKLYWKDCDTLYITFVDDERPADTFIDPPFEDFTLVESEPHTGPGGIEYFFWKLVRTSTLAN